MTATAELAVEASGLAKSYRDVRVLAGVDLRVPAGTVFALLGPNGAGKTTTVRILATLVQADGGQARVAGFDVAKERSRVRRQISLTGQFAALDEVQTGAENLRMMGRLSGLSRAAARQRATELLEQFDLTKAAGRRVATYSGGMRRRLDIAASLVARPSVIFLDEPSTGLDPQSRLAMWRIIEGLAASGVTIFLTTQYLEEAERLADRIAVLDAGQIIAEGTSAELKRKVAAQRLDITGASRAAFEELVRHFSGQLVHHDDGSLTVGVATEGDAAEIRALLDAADPGRDLIADFTVHSASLDDVFLTLTGHAQPENLRRPAMSDALIMAGRSLRLSARSPEALLTALMLPVMLMVVFVYLFGGAVDIGTEYVNYVVPGVLLLCAVTGASTTAVTVCQDMAGGIIDRFRSLDVSGTAVLAGHVTASLLRNFVSTLLVIAVAFGIGFRPHSSGGAFAAALGVLLLFVAAASWFAAAFGLGVRAPEAANSAMFFLMFFSYASSAFVPVRTMPSWLRGFATHQPATPVTETIRGLLLGHSAPLPLGSALAWCVGIGVVSMALPRSCSAAAPPERWA